MARQRVPGQDEMLQRLDEIARLLVLTLRRDQTLQEAIADLDMAGIGQSRIADLLGTSPAYVSVALARVKTSGTAPRPRRKSG